MSDQLTTQDREVMEQSRPAQEDFILVDGSSSMAGKTTETLEAIDNYVAQLRAENVNSTITVAAFSGSGADGWFDWRVIRHQVPVDQWREIRFDGEVSLGSGMTPLYDGINSMGRDFAQRMPRKGHALVITDGDENSSQTTVEQARGVLDWMRAQGWQITFLGADFQNSAQAKALGVDETNSVGVSVKRLIDATSLLAEKRARYSQYGTDMNMTADEKNEIGGFLPDHSNGK